MLTARRAVVVRNLEQWRPNAGVWRQLYQYLEHPSPTTVLILVQGSGEKPVDRIVGLTAHVEIDALSPELLRRWIATHARKNSIELQPEAVEHLIDALGMDLGSLSMEITKIAAAVSPDAPVTEQQVSHLVGVRRGETVVEWVEAVIQRDSSAVGLLPVVLSQPGVNAVRMVTAVGTALLGVRAARALLDDGTSPKLVTDQLFRFLRQVRPQGVGLWSEEARRWTRAAALWTGKELEVALGAAFETDRALKTTSLTEEQGVLASFIVRLGQRRSPVVNEVAA
jgi:DNA polymerase III delta subunit